MNEEIKVIPLLKAYAFAKSKGLNENVSEIKDMNIEGGSRKSTIVKKGLIIRLLKEQNHFDEFVESQWPTGKTTIGEKKVRNVLRLAAEYEDLMVGDESDIETEFEEAETSFEFALESHLRDFLARDLERIEPGLKLYNSEDQGGVEYSIDGGRIDILAVDRTGRFVVIELKLSQGRNKVLGQILYYMGWVDDNLGNGPCRGIVIANEISKELSTAVSRVPDVSLCKYKMSFSVEPISKA
jgi:RecB family endonuclease NucS